MSVDTTSIGTTRLERLARTVDSVFAAPHREEALASLLHGLIQISSASRGLALLMDGDTVVQESTRSGSGEALRSDEETRKLAARATIRFGQTRGGKSFAIETQSGRAVLCSSIEDRRSLGIVLERFQSEADPNLATTMSALIALTPQFRNVAPLSREARDIAANEQQALEAGGVGAIKFLKTVDELERDAIELALRQTGWKKDEAARRLGISRASIYMKVKKFGLSRPVL